MGSIRTILAISVVFTHSYGVVFVSGDLAVQLFYIISGFLISFVLIESTTYRELTAFYKNRFLRLFPIYWVVAILTLLAIFSSAHLLGYQPNLIKTFLSLDWIGKTALSLSNVILFGQDWIMFTGVREGSFQFVTNFKDTEVRVWTGLVVPQAWTLGVELSFYLIAPFVLRSLKLIAVLLCFSIVIRVYLVWIGLGFHDPWTYRFFPTELALFLFGALSHQILSPFYSSRKLLNDKNSIIIATGMAAYCCIYFLLPYREANRIFLTALFVLLLPFLFNFQRRFKWDSAIGDLSYPIYISHMLIIMVSTVILPKLIGAGPESIEGAILTVLITIGFSVALNATVGRTVERLRLTIKKSQVDKQSS